MKNEKFWKITAYVLGAIAAALLVLVLVLKILGRDILVWTYPIVGAVILFLICDEIARSIRRRREREEAEREQKEHPEEHESESELPKEAFEFDEPTEEQK